MKRIQLLAIITLLLVTGCSRQPVWNDRQLSLKGTHKIEAMPDHVSWQVEIHCVAASIEVAHQQMLDAVARIRERGKSLRIPDTAFSAGGIRQGTEWEWTEGRRRKSNQFFSELSLVVAIDDLSLYGPISERLFVDDSLVVSGVRFTYSKSDELYREALAGALAAADAKAKFVAQKAGVSLAGIRRVDLDENHYAAAPSLMMDVAEKATASLPALRPQAIEAAVSVTYEIK